MLTWNDIVHIVPVMTAKPAAFFEPIIRRWESVPAFCADVGCSEPVARQWIRGDSIPAAWFAPVARAGLKRGFAEITLEMLADRAERRRLVRDAQKPAEAA